MNPQSNPTSSPPRMLGKQVIIFSPPKDPDVRKVILKHPSTPHQAPSALAEKACSDKGKMKESSPARRQIKRKPSTIIVLGPHAYQHLDLFSSDESSNDRTHSTSRSFGRLPSHTRSRSISPTPTPRRVLPVSSASDRAFTPSPEPIDWLEFSDPQSAYDEYGSIEDPGSWSGDSWSDDYDSSSPAIITPGNSQPAPRVVFNPYDLAILFNQPALHLPPTPPSTPSWAKKRRASKSPDLSIVPSVSTPSTPFNTNNTLPVPQSPSSLSAPGRLFSLRSIVDADIDLSDEAASETSVSPRIIATTREDGNEEDLQCSACGKSVEYKKANKMIPCGHITCTSCFSSTISAVSPDRAKSQCVACATNLTTFERIRNITGSHLETNIKLPADRFVSYDIPVAGMQDASVVMRIDNIAWDVTHDIVESFLPSHTLSEQVSQAIHIPLDRYDGRTKDYLYIEAVSLDAAKHVLRARQNTYMPGGPLTGGKKRPVTITIVSHVELVTELRPHSSQELHSLLNLCHMALGPPTPASRFVKSRHGPFYALMSIMSKLTGKGSPAYWDLFHIASGAISLLAQTITRKTQFQSYYVYYTQHPPPAEEDDQVVLNKLLGMFESCFGMSSRLG
ncbi:hypothetical protein I302_105929 [Kwoniella bestiolae CBS 10118]|uniref:RING-type domain-containing protein n=1 Tax=Kwoniella bestiolae CBS 10118 TaxID=1296100 RepID=A0A1B9G2J9_9TREE|nr:hypothetical protein I302_05053 [Kwoniella bestiolae CBS 10118]OCF25240.1 hypothetical protein I302_05053 [Kwoniella bestiolae CBS 10118]